MPNVKQSHLRVFATVAELGSISSAARRLHRSPSAISMTVTNLEAQLGQPLFEADGKSHLTPFGDYVFRVTGEQLQRFDKVVAGIQAYANSDIGRIDIAAVPSFATYYLPDLLTNFIGKHPNVRLTIRDASSAEINRMVEKGDIDIGIASPGNNRKSLHFQPLFTDLLGVVCSHAHPLAKLKRPLLWQDLENQPFIINGTCALIQATEFQAILSNAEIEVQNTTSLLALIVAGVGITTLPELAIPEDQTDVVFKKIAYPELKRTISIISPGNRTLSPATKAFSETLQNWFGNVSKHIEN